MRKLITLCGLIAMSALGADVAGKWKGSIDLKLPGGESRTIPVLLQLSNTDTGLRGTIGGGEQDQHDIRSARIDGDRLDLLVEFGDKVVNLTLTANGDTLEGDITFTDSEGKGTGKTTMKRASGA